MSNPLKLAGGIARRFQAARGLWLFTPLTRWLAIGDAAMSFDPISSQGLLNALFTGLAGAEAADRHLAGDTISLSAYARIIREFHAIYRSHLSQCYRAEQRWPQAAFWRRRHS